MKKKILILCPFPKGQAAGQRLKYEQYFEYWEEEGYEIRVNENNLNNYKNFFTKSYLDSIEVLQDNITFKKVYAEPLKFKIDNFGKQEDINKQITEKFNVDSFPEIIYLTKYLGDYNISIYGTQYLIENAGYTLVLSKQ